VQTDLLVPLLECTRTDATKGKDGKLTLIHMQRRPVSGVDTDLDMLSELPSLAGPDHQPENRDTPLTYGYH